MRPFLILSIRILVSLALLYLAWTFYSRWSNSRSIQQAAEAEKVKADAQIVKMYAGDLKILSFYAPSGAIRADNQSYHIIQYS